jgi:hypothetical protein
MGNFSQILGALGPILEPILLQSWQSSILPTLQAEVAKVSSPDLQLLASAALGALDQVAQAEIKKL